MTAFVNRCSPFIARMFTVMVALVVILAATTARAERVVVYPVTGDADDERRGEIEDAIREQLGALGHEVIAGGAIQQGSVLATPTTSDQMVDVATANHAAWVIVAEASPLPGQYRLHLRVGYAPVRRVEELQVNVLESEEAARLHDVLSCLIRPEGLGDDAVRLTGGGDDAAAQAARDAAAQAARDAAARQAAADAARLAQEQAAAAAAERERVRIADAAAVAARARQHDWDTRSQYGGDGAHPWLFQLGIEADPILSSLRHAPGAGCVGDCSAPMGNGMLIPVSLRLGYAIPSLTGLEVRAGIDAVFGTTINGVGIVGGVTYLASPFTFPVFIGGSAEVGGFIGTSSSQSAGVLLRISPTVSWRPGGSFYLEADLPQLIYEGVGNVVAIGFGVRVGYRF